jgi:hypothetical protein
VTGDRGQGTGDRGQKERGSRGEERVEVRGESEKFLRLMDVF